MARPKKSNDKPSEESEVQLESSVEVSSEETSVEAKPEESKMISGSPLGKVRGKDLKNY